MSDRKPIPRAAEKARRILVSARDPIAGDCVEDAQVWAILAVADELENLCKQVEKVVTSLRDRDGNTLGTNAYYIHDWLKTIAEK